MIWLKPYIWLKKYWSTLLASTSIIGYSLSQIIPPLHQFASTFIFLGINAIIWSIIEIKLKIVEKRPSVRYSSLREARPEILKSICDTLSKNYKEQIFIHIIGGRIRTISDILREIKNNILAGKLRTKNATVIIYCMDPKFLTSMELPKLRKPQIVFPRNEIYSQLVQQFRKELLEYNELEIFKKNRICVQVIHYRAHPVYYAFLIGKSKLFWGIFTWRDDTEDFEGPGNPCYFYKNTDDAFDDYWTWIKNRLDFFHNCQNK